MKAGALGAILLLAGGAAACGKAKPATTGRALPSGDGVLLADGLPADLAETEGLFARGGLAHLFVPAVRLGHDADASSSTVAPPATPFRGSPIVFVVSAGDDFAGRLASGAGEELAAEAGRRLSAALAKRDAWGRVEGVHLELPFREPDAERFGAFAAKVRAAIPKDLFLTGALAFAPGEKERVDVVGHLAALDGFVASVFGEGAHADPVSTEALGKPWWARYAPGAVGVWTDASGQVRGRLSDRYLGALSDDSSVGFSHDIALTGEVGADFVLQPSAPIAIGTVRLAPGDRIAFRQPALADLLARFGSDLQGRRLVRGRLVALEGVAESERVFTLEALSDVVLGRPLRPDVRVTLSVDPAGIHLSAENVATHASLVSRTGNWVEVDVPGGRIRDAQPGAFDRYEMYDAEGRSVTPGRAARVRFFETLVGPRERIADAAIFLRGGASPDCCRHRAHWLAASGEELESDWVGPPPRPAASPRAPARGKAKRR